MKLNFLRLTVLLTIILWSCSKGGSDTGSMSYTPGATAGGGSATNPGGSAGVITAGEWNDLNNWSFWDTLILRPEYNTFPATWSIYNNNRISVSVKNANNVPANNVPITLKKNGSVIYAARTDNKGRAELWADIFSYNTALSYAGLSLDINNGSAIISNVKPYSVGINEATLALNAAANKIELAFVVDATGSMTDELSYFQTELYDVISRVKDDHSSAAVFTSSVFYRDEGDAYVTRVSPFTQDVNTTVNFIRNQSADGGGDFPESVHTALEKAEGELQWSADAKTRIIFLLLDAPPHKEPGVISSLQNSIKKLSARGVKVIPIAASGIDKETEFLLRFVAMSTNGTYVFITNHSGIGGTHIQASVGAYTVEFLNNLMVRLINKYAE
jgi:hypothetical protein